MYDNLMYDIWFFLYIIFCESNHHHLLSFENYWDYLSELDGCMMGFLGSYNLLPLRANF